jgi:glucokinase
MILVGDIGGTKVDIALCRQIDGRLVCEFKQRYQTQQYKGLPDIIRDFAKDKSLGKIRCCFGVAGPIKNGICKPVNIPWTINAEEVTRELNLEQTWLINDLEAVAYGVSALADDDLITLNEGAVEQPGNAAVIAAGTGLGESGLFWNGARWIPFASEGGHCNYAPRNNLEIDLLKHLAGRFGEVSYERIVSGMGIFNIYQFLRDTGKAEEPGWLKKEMESKDPSTVITDRALDDSCSICVQTLDLFISNYGAESGNLALKMLARSGLYIGGGIAPKIASKLAAGVFMDSFTAKGRFKPLLQAIPVKIIKNKEVNLLGAASFTLLQKM